MAGRVPRGAAKESADNPYYAIGHRLPNMEAAAVTCLSFSLELYFKCLIRMGNKPIKRRTHDLVELFSLVGRRHQVTIKRYFRRNIQGVRGYLEQEYAAQGRPMPKLDFDYVLSGSKDAFTIMRYLY